MLVSFAAPSEMFMFLGIRSWTLAPVRVAGLHSPAARYDVVLLQFVVFLRRMLFPAPNDPPARCT